MADVSVSVVPMLDCSSSMAGAMPLVIIDGKAFVRAARPGDQIGIVEFQSSASMLYPTAMKLETVDPALNVTAAAVAKIAGLRAAGLTNMAGAATIANTLLASATNATRAYMMLSDGEWNQGGDPGPILSSSYPIFICGLGSHMQKSYVDSMLAKNPRSQYLASPNAYEMMKVFNSIRGLAADAGVAENSLIPMSGTDYSLTPVTVSGGTDECQFTAVWSQGYSYTSGIPGPNQVRVSLIAPDGTTQSTQPSVAEPGYVIFNLEAPQPGEWHVLSEYAAVPSGNYSTTAGFEFNSTTRLSLDVQAAAATGEPVTLRASLEHEDAPVEQGKVWARVSAPRFELADLLAEHADAINRKLAERADGAGEDRAAATESVSARVAALRELWAEHSPHQDPFPRGGSFRTFEQAGDGTWTADLGPTPHSGPYVVEVFATATLPSSKAAFKRTTQATVLVGGEG